MLQEKGFGDLMNSLARSVLAVLAFSLTGACGANGGTSYFATQNSLAEVAGRKVGPGPILQTRDYGQVFGYDVDWNGRDGILSSARLLNSNGSYEVSVETFDTTTAKITKSFAHRTGAKVSYLVDGIFDKDAALVTQFDTPREQFDAIRHYRIVNPVTVGKFNEKWRPPVKDLSVLQYAENQSTPTSVVYALELRNHDAPDLVVSDIAHHRQINLLHLDDDFAPNTEPQLAQDTVNNLAVMATSPTGGHGGVPKIWTIDLKTGKRSGFNGASCPGSEGCGSPNGISYDSATGIACTTTELDAGIEFYDVPKRTGFHEVLPVGQTDVAQYYSGTYVASDPLHKLCLVVQAESGSSPSGSSVQVYDENGSFVESIDGLNFTYNSVLAVPVRIALNPNTRTGWVNGPLVDQLQEFSY
jgi:hypothetical protein